MTARPGASDLFVHVEMQGNLLALKSPFKVSRLTEEPPKRGAITTFTRQSRVRLLRKMARLEPTRVVFVTLTYPARYPDAMTAKGHLRALFERIRRRYAQSSAIWRLEYQERGAPHFHILFFDLPYLPFALLRQWWSEIIRAYVDASLPRVRIEKIRSKQGAMYYAAKYCAKMATTEDQSFFINSTYLHAGRWWGVFNHHHLPYADRYYIITEQITEYGFRYARRYLEMLSPSKYPHELRGRVVFTDGKINHLKCLLRLLRPDMAKSNARPLERWSHQSGRGGRSSDTLFEAAPHVRVSRISVLPGAGVVRGRGRGGYAGNNLLAR